MYRETFSRNGASKLWKNQQHLPPHLISCPNYDIVERYRSAIKIAVQYHLKPLSQYIHPHKFSLTLSHTTFRKMDEIALEIRRILVVVMIIKIKHASFIFSLAKKKL
jgi:hypothetical protein